MIEWPDTLVDEIARRHAILFLGSGVSRQSVGQDGKRPPLWVEFLNSGVLKCRDAKVAKEVRRLIKSNDLLTACEVLKDSLGVAWTELIEQEFVRPKYEPVSIHESIFRLDLRVVVTQNFDRIYDTFAASESKGTVIVKSYVHEDAADLIRRRHRLVLKAHGSIDSINEMVFTRGDYARARNRHPGFYALMDGLMLTHTCLFLGCGMSDPDISMMLERAAHLHPSAQSNFIALGDSLSLPIRRAYKKTQNIEVLAYSSRDNHVELSRSLESLVSKVEARRDELAASRDW